MNNLPWIILIGENLLLLIALTIYLTRKCTKCQSIKCIEKIFSKVCKKCNTKPKQSKTKDKDWRTEVF